MKTVNGYYLVKSEKTEQKSAGIFVAMSNDSTFIKCEVIECPRDGSNLELNELLGDNAKYIYAFKEKLKEVSVDGESFFLVRKDDIVGFSFE